MRHAHLFLTNPKQNFIQNQHTRTSGQYVEPRASASR